MASRWALYEIQAIKRAYPEFEAFVAKLCIDSIVVEFLARYEVYVKPASSAEGRSTGDLLSDGMVAGLGRTAALAANQSLRGQQKNTAVQEWTQWKQWALGHKDFEAFRADKSSSYDILKKRLESDEFASEWNANKEIFLARLREKGMPVDAEGKSVFVKLMMWIIFFVLLCTAMAGLYKGTESNDSNNKKSSLLNSTTALTATALGKGIRKAPNQT